MLRGDEHIKYIPNILSILRILSSLSLLVIEPFTPLFFAIYLFCGISDALDGWIARKFHLVSKLGQQLDSVADLILTIVLLLLFFIHFVIPLWSVYWGIAIIAVRLVALAIGYIHNRQILLLHTYSNKLTGLAIFCSPLLYPLIGFIGTIALLCIIATIAALEELLIMLFVRTPHRDIISIFAK